MQRKNRDRLSKAIRQLIIKHPFFATTVLKHKIREDPTCQTLWIDGVTLGYNPEFVEKQTFDRLITELMHLVLHIANLHHTRRGHRDKKMWNEAGDHVVNHVIKKTDRELPDDALCDSQFEDKSTEQAYTIIQARPKPPQGGQGQGQGGDENGSKKGQSDQGQGDQPQDQPKQDQSDQQSDQGGQGESQGMESTDDSSQDSSGQGDPGGMGEVRDFPGKDDSGSPSPAEISEQEQQVKIQMAQADSIAKKRGTQSGAISELVADLNQPDLDWREVLARFLDERARNDYSWNRPSSRFLQQGCYLPHLFSQEYGKVLLLVDVSGSVNKDDVNRFSAETLDILASYEEQGQTPELTMAFFNTKILEDQTQVLEPGDTPRFYKGGGTNYESIFRWAEDKHDKEFKAIIVFTDGECDEFPEEEPETPVLWAGVHKHFNPPFGEIATWSE